LPGHALVMADSPKKYKYEMRASVLTR
jgi:hypothetical protein